MEDFRCAKYTYEQVRAQHDVSTAQCALFSRHSVQVGGYLKKSFLVNVEDFWKATYFPFSYVGTFENPTQATTPTGLQPGFFGKNKKRKSALNLEEGHLWFDDVSTAEKSLVRIM